MLNTLLISIILSNGAVHAFGEMMSSSRRFSSSRSETESDSPSDSIDPLINIKREFQSMFCDNRNCTSNEMADKMKRLASNDPESVAKQLKLNPMIFDISLDRLSRFLTNSPPGSQVRKMIYGHLQDVKSKLFPNNSSQMMGNYLSGPVDPSFVNDLSKAMILIPDSLDSQDFPGASNDPFGSSRNMFDNPGRSPGGFSQSPFDSGFSQSSYNKPSSFGSSSPFSSFSSSSSYRYGSSSGFN